MQSHERITNIGRSEIWPPIREVIAIPRQDSEDFQAFLYAITEYTYPGQDCSARSYRRDIARPWAEVRVQLARLGTSKTEGRPR
jgi:hypothetical protein